MAGQTQVLMLASKHFPDEATSLSNHLPPQSVLHVLQTYSQDICTVATELSWRHPREKSSSVVLGMKFIAIHYHLVQYLRETTYKEEGLNPWLLVLLLGVQYIKVEKQKNADWSGKGKRGRGRTQVPTSASSAFSQTPNFIQLDH